MSAPGADDFRLEELPRIDAPPDNSTPQATMPPAASTAEQLDPLAEFPDFADLFEGLARGSATPSPEASVIAEADQASRFEETVSIDEIEPPPDQPGVEKQFELRAQEPVEDLVTDEAIPADTPDDEIVSAGALHAAHVEPVADSPDVAHLEPVADSADFEQLEPVADSAYVEHLAPAADSADFEQVPAADFAQFDALSPETASFPVPPVETAQAGGARIGRRELMTGVLGAIGGGILIFALLSARGAASPEAASVNVPAGRPLQTPAAARARSGISPTWNANPASWVGTERNSTAFELAATSKVPVWLRQVQPMLVVRCRAKATEVFVFTDSPARMEAQDGNHTVRIRFDGQAENTERWPDSAEHDALFAPDGAAFIRQLVGAHRLEFGFTPHNANPVVASFDVEGLGAHLAKAARQCGWKNQ